MRDVRGSDHKLSICINHAINKNPNVSLKTGQFKYKDRRRPKQRNLQKYSRAISNF